MHQCWNRQKASSSRWRRISLGWAGLQRTDVTPAESHVDGQSAGKKFKCGSLETRTPACYFSHLMFGRILLLGFFVFFGNSLAIYIFSSNKLYPLDLSLHRLIRRDFRKLPTPRFVADAENCRSLSASGGQTLEETSRLWSKSLENSRSF